MYPLITLEEHYLCPSLIDFGNYGDMLQNSYAPPVHRQLLSIDQGRLEDMDANSVKLQVISHIPLDAPATEVCKANTSLYGAIKLYPKRFAGFALLDMKDPDAAAAELDRCVRNLGFVGALIGNTTDNGRFFDTPPFDAVFEKAQELDVPIYLHPTYPSAELSKQLYSGPWDQRMEMNLGGWCWGWHSMVGLHFLRLYASGVFERFPNLKMIIGHMGEMLPFMLDRIYPISGLWPGAESRSRTLKQVWESNIWVTTSGMFSLAPMSCLLQTTKACRIMYSVDYPLASNAKGLEFMEMLKESGLVTDLELEDIAYNNAVQLLKLNMTV